MGTEISNMGTEISNMRTDIRNISSDVSNLIKNTPQMIEDAVAKGVATAYAAAGQCAELVSEYAVALKQDLSGSGAYCTGSMRPGHSIGISASHCMQNGSAQPFHYLLRKADMALSTVLIKPTVERVLVQPWIYSRQQDFVVFIASAGQYFDAAASILQLRELAADFALQALMKPGTALLGLAAHQSIVNSVAVIATALQTQGMSPLGQLCASKVPSDKTAASGSGVRLALPDSMMVAGDENGPLLSAQIGCDGFRGHLWAMGVHIEAGNSGAVLFSSLPRNGTCTISPHSIVSGSITSTKHGVASVLPAFYPDRLIRLADETERILRACNVDMSRVPASIMPRLNIDQLDSPVVIDCHAE